MRKYNNHLLPNPPEYDTSSYPYACVQHVEDSGLYHFRYSSEPFYKKDNIITNIGEVYVCDGIGITWSESYAIEASSLSLEPNTIIWCNVDILDESDAVFLKASELEKPFGADQLRSWISGLVIGLASNPVPMNKIDKIPVAYLYNGVRLPPLPDVDRTKYPFVYIWYNTAFQGGYCVIFSSVTFHRIFVHYDILDSDGWQMLANEDGNIIRYFMWLSKGEFAWELNASESILRDDVQGDDPIWANYNVLDENGETVLAASEPVPVYAREVSSDG